MSKATIGNFTAKCDRSLVTIGNFKFSPGEGDKISYILGMAGGMSGFSALPPTIKNTPFAVEFSPNGTHKLVRQNSDEFVKFAFDEIDDFIRLIDLALSTIANLNSVDKTAKSTGHSPIKTGDIIDGR